MVRKSPGAMCEIARFLDVFQDFLVFGGPLFQQVGSRCRFFFFPKCDHGGPLEVPSEITGVPWMDKSSVITGVPWRGQARSRLGPLC